MLIRWHGHSCFEIRDDRGLAVVTDPHDGKSIGIKPPVVEADIVLMSHDHFDHNCVRIVGGDKVVVKGPGARTVKGIPVKGVHSFHDEVGGEKRGENIMFRFRMDNLTLCHLGDLGEVLSREQVEDIGRVDILFIPVGGTFTLDADMAWKVIDMIGPRVVVPMHFRVGGLSLSIAPVDGFLEKASKDNIVRVGNMVELDRGDLPDGTEIWVFSL